MTSRFACFYKCFLAGFFTLHYGLFHWGYYSFIVESGLFGAVNLADPGIWLSCGLFLANHLYSYITYRHDGPKGAGYINEQFFTPYRRIIPMHLTIIFGSIVIFWSWKLPGFIRPFRCWCSSSSSRRIPISGLISSSIIRKRTRMRRSQYL